MFKKAYIITFWTAIILLSSCHTRKGLDAFFEIPFQKTLNVSKANLQQNSCAELEWNQITEYNESNLDAKHYDDDTSLSHLTKFENLQFFKCYTSFSIPIEKDSPSSKLPLYLLYQHFKVDLV